MKPRVAVGVVALVLLGACSSGGSPAAGGTSPKPSPTGVYDPDAPAGGGTFRTPDGTLRFTFPPPWRIADETDEYVSLVNFTLTGAEIARREEAGVYAYRDGEGSIEVQFGGGDYGSLESFRSEQCRAGGSTVRVRECTTTKIDGLDAAWVLVDHSNDSDCTCRQMLLLVGGNEYVFVGGGCIDCAATSRLLREVEQILRSVTVAA